MRIPISVYTLLFVSAILLLSSCRSSEPVTDTETQRQTQRELSHPLPDSTYADYLITSNSVDIDSLIGEMTLREKIGQLFVVPAFGSFTNDYDLNYRRLKNLVTEYKIGGLIFMQGDIYGQAMLTNRLQSISKVPLWITQDMEYGAAMRIRGTTRITPAMGIAATGNPDNAYIKGKITGREARALGVHQVFAPVLDVNNNPDNPVINVRSYAGTPEKVALYGGHFIAGIESEGVLATAKHFPGHGDTDIDSHLSLPTIIHDYARIDSLELVPFRVSIENGLRSVMTAHIAYPGISENIGRPATLDESVLHRILVDSLQFNGLVVTDGLEMKGITDHFSPGEAVVQALLAGADMMLISPDVRTAITEVYRAVDTGRISEERIDRSVRKLLELKKMTGLFENRTVDVDELSYKINTPDYQAEAERIARESVTILKNRRNLLPLREVNHPRILVISVADDRSGSTGNILAREVRRYHSNVTSHTLDRRSGNEEKTDIIRAANDADLIIIGSFIMVRSHQPIQLGSDHLELLKRITALQKPSILMAFGNPYIVRDLPDADVHLLAWASNNEQVRQTVPALFGGLDVRGRLPSYIPGQYEFGAGIDIPHDALRFDRPESVGLSSVGLMEVDHIMQKAMDDSTFPGGVVGVMRDGALVWNQPYGYFDYSKTRAVQDTDSYDLASLTKVIATTTAVMRLVDERKLSLDDRVHKFIPEFDSGKKRQITIRHLLLHTSGLPAFKVYVDRYKTRGEILNAIKNEPLEQSPGERYVYSDLGFILLADIVEQITDQRLDRYVRNRFYGPMAMYTAYFNPRSVGWLARITPPTEIDDVWNRGTVRGVVHDERAYFMNGVAGHAGLFGSVRDVATYAQMLLNNGTYAGRQFLSQEVIEQFTQRQSPLNPRGYGFDRKSEGFSSAGELTGPNTYGHLGFTGTSLWIDPDENIAIILLTNRTYPNREMGKNISRVRADIADAVMRSIIERKSENYDNQ